MYLASFTRWLGRGLSPLEKNVLYPIEKRRQQALRKGSRGYPRFFVDDTGIHGDRVGAILLEYLHWLHTRISTGTMTCVIGRTRRRAREVTDTFGPKRHLWRRSRLLFGSARAPDRLRGHTINTFLLLGADTYGRSSRVSHEWNRPFRLRFQSYERVRQVVAAIVPSCGASMVIVHGNPLTHPRSVYARQRKEAMKSPPGRGQYMVIDPRRDYRTGRLPEEAQSEGLQDGKRRRRNIEKPAAERVRKKYVKKLKPAQAQAQQAAEPNIGQMSREELWRWARTQTLRQLVDRCEREMLGFEALTQRICRAMEKLAWMSANPMNRSHPATVAATAPLC